MPNYTYFEMHDPAAYYDTDTQKYLCSLVPHKLKILI